jgi:hypothetical protein
MQVASGALTFTSRLQNATRASRAQINTGSLVSLDMINTASGRAGAGGAAGGGGHSGNDSPAGGSSTAMSPRPPPSDAMSDVMRMISPRSSSFVQKSGSPLMSSPNGVAYS